MALVGVGVGVGVSELGLGGLVWVVLVRVVWWGVSNELVNEELLVGSV